MNASRRLTHAMSTLGQAARKSSLLSLGITRVEIETALASGYLQRPKRGWYVTGSADSDQRRAIAAGARLGCVTALRRWGVWSGPDNLLHLHCNPTSSRLPLDAAHGLLGNQPVLPHPDLPRRQVSGLDKIWRCTAGNPIIHWRAQASTTGALDWIVSPADALAQAVRCQDDEHAVACVDSALRHGVVSAQVWAKILRDLPERLRTLGQSADARADSGNETIVRLRLIAAGLKVELQAQLPGIGHVDLVVEGLVALEVDSETFHGSKEQRRIDRSRTLTAHAWGMPSLRIGPEHLPADQWPLALAAVQRQLADARALRRLRTGPLLSG